MSARIRFWRAVLPHSPGWYSTNRAGIFKALRALLQPFDLLIAQTATAVASAGQGSPPHAFSLREMGVPQ
jgi:hypothetical protein